MSDSIAEVMEPAPGEAPKKPKGDLGVRTVSAVVMVALASAALWFGGYFWSAFVFVLAVGVFWEWTLLAFAFSKSIISRLAWVLFGLLYVGIAGLLLIEMRVGYDGIFNVGVILISVIGVDVGAYFAGRLIGGPKIAPSISPSKTWAGLLGGALGGGLLFAALLWAWPAGLCEAYVYGGSVEGTRFGLDDRCHLAVPIVEKLWQFVLIGIPIAVFAQAGDFFESWMKRRAGVKDSGRLIPGHGGLFDRLDGLLAVCFVVGIWAAVVR